MKTHELGAKLLRGPNVELSASVDISSSDEDAGKRAFGSDLSEVVLEPSGEVTLLFSSGYINQ